MTHGIHVPQEYVGVEWTSPWWLNRKNRNWCRLYKGRTGPFAHWYEDKLCQPAPEQRMVILSYPECDWLGDSWGDDYNIYGVIGGRKRDTAA